MSPKWRRRAARARRPVRLVTANMHKDRGGDRAYRRHLRALVRRGRTRRGVLFLTEVGHGKNSTRLRGIKIRVRGKSRMIVGHVGAHRGVARGHLRIDGRTVHLFAVHGLHRRTVGREAADAYYDELAPTIRTLTQHGRAWIVAGDFNLGVTQVARLLGGTAFGTGIDGFVISRELVPLVARTGIDGTGKARGWTDHPSPWMDLNTKEKP